MTFRETILIVLFGVSVMACGNDSTIFGTYEATDIDVQDKSLRVGQSTRVRVFFSSETDSFGEPDDVEVVVQLPRALGFVSGTSAIYDESFDDQDEREPNSVVICETGETFVIYRFDDNELSGRGFRGGDFSMRFDIEAIAENAVAEIEAAAGQTQEYGCGGFPGEVNEVVEVGKPSPLEF
jgi:hypothetical protein